MTAPLPEPSLHDRRWPPSWGAWVAWHTIAPLALALALAQARLGARWQLDLARWLPFLAGLVVGYIAVVAVITHQLRRVPTTTARALMVRSLVLLASFYLLLVIGAESYSRSVLVVFTVLAAGSIALSVRLPLARLRRGAAGWLVLAVGSWSLGFFTKPTRAPVVRRQVEAKVLPSAVYALTATYHYDLPGRLSAIGGGLAQIRDRYLLALGGGQLYAFSWDSTGKLAGRRLPGRIPMNTEEFARDVDSIPSVNVTWFRTGDILAQDLGERFRLFATHHYWDATRRCTTVRVSVAEASTGAFLAGAETPGWRTIFEAAPCLRIKRTGDGFAGRQMGGELVLLGEHRLLLALGDEEHDGVNSPLVLPQDTSASYGKTIEIDLRTGAATMVSLGHRNPQGLHVGPDGEVWLTEHGPQGGDELNMIRKGRNYGWPVATYGTEYGATTWPLSERPGHHDGYELPVYAWVPSVGVADVIVMRGSTFELWEGDLVVGSLENRGLWRLHMEGDRVVFAERIDIGWRVRDVLEDAEGRLVLWAEQSRSPPTGNSVIVIVPAVERDDDEVGGAASDSLRARLVLAQCQVCHGLSTGAPGTAPHLAGIVGRSVAGLEGYQYSEALSRIGGKWTEARLDEFLRDPRAYAPGTAMDFGGLTDSGVRQLLIQYLKANR